MPTSEKCAKWEKVSEVENAADSVWKRKIFNVKLATIENFIVTCSGTYYVHQRMCGKMSMKLWIGHKIDKEKKKRKQFMQFKLDDA